MRIVEFECDLEIIGWKPHSKKEGQVGSIEVATSDAGIQGSVGSKIDDKLRVEMYEMAMAGELVGRICTIRIHDLTVKKGDFSIYLPRFIEFRDDKEEADSAKKVLDMVNWDAVE